MKNNYSYIGISFIILIFGIWAVPKIIATVSKPDLITVGKVPDFSFTNQHGKTISNKDYTGKVYVAEFFFTTCPTICPVMNESMVKIQNKFLGNPNLGMASFTIDPEHDTPEVLKRKYGDNIGFCGNSNIQIWETGDKEKIFELSNAGFNLYVGEGPESDGGFEHSGFFALVDQEGNIRCRIDENNNPIIYYDALDDKMMKWLQEDIKNLL